MRLPKLSLHSRIAARTLAWLSVFLFLGALVAPLQSFADSGLSEAEIAALHAYPEWVSKRGGTCTASGSTTLTGSDNEEKVWNYFKGKGVDDIHTAAVIGNLEQESSLNPIIMEVGGTSQNPDDAGYLGWGLAQWTGNERAGETTGEKVKRIFQQAGATGPVYDLGTQLDVIWWEMSNSPPTGYSSFFAKFTATKSLADAVSFFQKYFEGGANYEPRFTNASNALQKYGNSPLPTDTSGNQDVTAPVASGCASGSLSPNCQSADGVAKIICAAKTYDSVSYSETVDAGHQGGAAWHASCPVVGPSCFLDCSGLVNIAVYDAFGVDLRENTTSERSDDKNWQTIPFSQLQPGDLIQPNSGHVEIVDHVNGNTIYTFGAHDPSPPQSSQVGPSQYSDNSSNLYLHYIGPGAS